MGRLRLKSPFVLATVGGMVALLGDKLWLAYDWLIKAHNDAVPHGLVYWWIGVAFGVGMALMAWSVVLHRRNGFARREVRDEIEHRRREQRRRRFRRIADRARELAAARERRRVDPAARTTRL